MTFFVSIVNNGGVDIIGGRAFLDSLHRLLPSTDVVFEAEPPVMLLSDPHTAITLTSTATNTYLYKERQTRRILAGTQAVVYIFDENLLSTESMFYHLQLVSDYLPQHQLPWIWVVDNYNTISMATPEMIHLPAHLSFPTIAHIHRCCFRYDYGTLRLWQAICARFGGTHG